MRSFSTCFCHSLRVEHANAPMLRTGASAVPRGPFSDFSAKKARNRYRGSLRAVMRLEVSPRAGRTAATVKLGLAIVLVCTLLFCLVDLLGGPIYSLSTKTWLPERRGDKLIGGIEGTVKEADSATRTVRVASGFLGLGSLPVVVTPETIIIVQGKLGGFGDLARRLRVRVAYEILRGRLLATRVHVLDQWSQPS